MGPIASEILFPQTGIAAGSAFATYELTLYLRDAIIAHEAACPNVTLSIHVDDISQSVAAQTATEVIELLTASANLIASAIEGRLGMPFAEDKGLIVATSPELARELRLALGPQAGVDHHTVRRLGVDYGLSIQGRSKMPVRHGRMKNAIARMKILKKSESTDHVPRSFWPGSYRLQHMVSNFTSLCHTTRAS
jgi:hypothetical protein